MSEFEAIAAGERERTYRFLSSLCLKPPLGSLISMMRDGSILSAIENDGESKSYAELKKFVKDTSKMINLKDELEAEHTSLFVLPSGVLPHEAVYLDKEKRLGGRVTMSVRQFYEKAGTDILEKCIEMPDHIGMELEFMGHLCKIERELWEKDEFESLQKCIQFQKGFLEEHLLKWVYQCCEKIIEKTTYGFYRAIGHWIMEFMRSEEEYVPELYAKYAVREERYAKQ